MTLVELHKKDYKYIYDGKICSQCGDKTGAQMYVPYYELLEKKRNMSRIVLTLRSQRVYCGDCVNILLEKDYHKISSLLNAQ